METEHNETVVEKAVNFVKDVLGVQHDGTPAVEAEPEYPDTAPEVTAENAMRLDPDAFMSNSAGQISPAGSYVAPMDAVPLLDETDAERLRREVDEPPKKSVSENISDVVRRENGI
jgi:hypothetical protein